MKIEKNERKIKEIFTNYFKEAPEDKPFDLTKNKGFINAILLTQENKDKLYKKFDWIHTYFTQTEKFQNWAKDKQFKKKAENFDFSQLRGGNIDSKTKSKSIHVTEEENKKFNDLLRGFINDFDEIVTIDNILDNIRIVDYFTRE